MIFLKKVEDKTGDILDVYFQKDLIMCPAFSSFLKVYAEIVDKGFSNPAVTWDNNKRVIWAQKDGKIAGGICYEFQQVARIGWIVLSFTDPEFRGRGINEIIHNLMEVDIKKLGGDRICSLVHVDNVSRLRSAEKVGLKPQFYRMNKFID